MKPAGAYFTAGGGLIVRKPSRTEDAIWNAVEEAIREGWTARQFRDEASEAWEHALKEQAKRAREDLR